MSKRKRIIIAGGSGFVGSILRAEFRQTQEEILILSRSNQPVRAASKVIVWDAKTVAQWKEELEGANTIINLCGSNVTVPWTPQNRQRIETSRIEPTRAIGQAIQECKNPPKVWINASAIGYYGNTDSKEVTEASKPGKGFLAEVCAKWEAAVDEYATPETRKIKLRIGVVLGKGGRLVTRLVTLTKWGLGGAVGNGEQFISWIHADDIGRLVRWITDTEIYGPLNATAPYPTSNGQFMATMRKALHRPWAPPVPEPLVRLGCRLMRMQPELVLEGQRVVPQIALGRGFEYKFPQLLPALQDLLKGH